MEKVTNHGYRKEQAMEIGSKIKAARQIKKMTQAELCGDFFTRNMLSAIENNRALPSLPALEYLVEKLEISASYFFSNDTNPLPYMVEFKTPYFRKLSEDNKHEKLIDETEPYTEFLSNELKLLVANSCYEVGQQKFVEGKLEKGKELFKKAQGFYSELRVIPMVKNCQTVIKTIESFLRNSIPTHFECFNHNRNTTDFIFYLYIIYLIDHGMVDKASSLYDTVKFEYQPFRFHINSRLAAAKFNYSRAKELLFELVFLQDNKMPVPFMNKIIQELEDYCLKTGDYKTAYDCTVIKNNYDIS